MITFLFADLKYIGLHEPQQQQHRLETVWAAQMRFRFCFKMLAEVQLPCACVCSAFVWKYFEPPGSVGRVGLFGEKTHGLGPLVEQVLRRQALSLRDVTDLDRQKMFFLSFWQLNMVEEDENTRTFKLLI